MGGGGAGRVVVQYMKNRNFLGNLKPPADTKGAGFLDAVGPSVALLDAQVVKSQEASLAYIGHPAATDGGEDYNPHQVPAVAGEFHIAGVGLGPPDPQSVR